MFKTLLSIFILIIGLKANAKEFIGFLLEPDYGLVTFSNDIQNSWSKADNTLSEYLLFKKLF